VSVGAISLLNPLVPDNQATSAGNSGSGFGQALNDAITKLSDSQQKADDTVTGFLTGQVQDVHQVTVAMEEAKISMELAVEVRNRVVSAYQQIWQMPV